MAPNLTQREREIIACIFEGKTSKVIARNLNISVHTVRKHRANLMNKVGAHSERQLLQSSELQVLCPKASPARS